MERPCSFVDQAQLEIQTFDGNKLIDTQNAPQQVHSSHDPRRRSLVRSRSRGSLCQNLLSARSRTRLSLRANSWPPRLIVTKQEFVDETLPICPFGVCRDHELHSGRVHSREFAKLSRSKIFPTSSGNPKILADYQPWFGDPDHIDVGYNSQDPNVLRKQIENARNMGIYAFAVDWYGSRRPFLDRSTALLAANCQRAALPHRPDVRRNPG